MIHTSRQLKALVRNRSNGNSAQAQIIIRNYIMERFLERISLSKYRDNFVLKGGVLISALVGVENRATMDIDTTIKNLPLTIEDVTNIMTEIIQVPVEDGIIFSIKRVVEIMDEAEYPGVRAILEAELDSMRTPLKIDISTGDAITPKEIEFLYQLMFENRSISIYAYNIETVLAEKMETVISRGIANTRMRDFYDLYILQRKKEGYIDYQKVKMAFTATSERRHSEDVMQRGGYILEQVYQNEEMQKLWRDYQRKFLYADGIPWNEVMCSINGLYKYI